MDLAQNLGRSVSLTVEGKDYMIGPIGLNELADFTTWIRLKPVQDAIYAMKSAPPAVAEKVIQSAWDDYAAEAKKGEAIDMGQLFGCLAGDLQAMRHLFWLAVRRNHPEVTKDQAGNMVTPGNIMAVSRLLDEASGVSGLATDPTQTT